MKEINSVEKYITYILGLKKENEDLGLGSYQWFFRGQSDISWSILPNVFREDRLKKEYSIIQDAVRHNPFEFKQLTEFETLTKLQHYGLGTRLLDVTLNPLVALYFASEPAVVYEKGKDKRYRQVEKDGVVFYKHGPWHSLNELCVKIAMRLPFIDFDESTTVSSLLDCFKQQSIISEIDYESLKSNDYKYFLEYIQKSYFMITSHSNERLIRQSGAFVLPTAIKINNENGISTGEMIAEKAFVSLNSEFSDDILIIPSKSKSYIREQLDFLNINEATMFPELEHQMVYIQGKQKNISGCVPFFTPFEVQDKKEIIIDYNDDVPDVNKIIPAVISDINNDQISELVSIISPQIEYIDWKSKDQIRSQIKLAIYKYLKQIYSITQSKRYSESILKLLLSPTENFIKN